MKPLPCLMVDQIEFADVVVLNKIDLLPADERDGLVEKLKKVIAKLNPVAKVVVPEKPKFEDFKVDGTVLNTKLFDMEKASTSAGWLQELAKVHIPESEEYGITSFVFREKERPFHPERLANILEGFGNLHKPDVDPKVDIFAGSVACLHPAYLLAVLNQQNKVAHLFDICRRDSLQGYAVAGQLRRRPDRYTQCRSLPGDQPQLELAVSSHKLRAWEGGAEIRGTVVEKAC